MVLLQRNVYTVPAGQTNGLNSATLLSARRQAEPALVIFLDDIKFQTGASLIAKKSISTAAEDDSMLAYIGEIVTVTVDM